MPLQMFFNCSKVSSPFTTFNLTFQGFLSIHNIQSKVQRFPLHVLWKHHTSISFRDPSNEPSGRKFIGSIHSPQNFRLQPQLMRQGSFRISRHMGLFWQWLYDIAVISTEEGRSTSQPALLQASSLSNVHAHKLKAVIKNLVSCQNWNVHTKKSEWKP